MVPFVPGNFVWGLVYGAAAIAYGIPVADATVMSAAIWSATAQLAALRIWNEPPLTLFATSLILSLRFAPMAMAAAAGLRQEPPWRRAALMCLIADASFVSLARLGWARVEPGRLLGTWLALYSTWVGGTLLGGLIGLSVDPRWLGLADSFTAVIFVVFAVDLCRSKAGAFAGVAAAVGSIALSNALPAGAAISVAGLGASLLVAGTLGVRR